MSSRKENRKRAATMSDLELQDYLGLADSNNLLWEYANRELTERNNLLTLRVLEAMKHMPDGIKANFFDQLIDSRICKLKKDLGIDEE